jgi:hypothetical protein
MYAGLFGVKQADDPEFGHLVETALFAQRFHEHARINYARWGKEDNEVDMVELSAALKPVTALEIKWSDKHVTNSGQLKGLISFSNTNRLPVVWATTYSKVGHTPLDGGGKIVHWPAAALAFHYGVNAVQGRLAGFEAQLRAVADV